MEQISPEWPELLNSIEWAFGNPHGKRHSFHKFVFIFNKCGTDLALLLMMMAVWYGVEWPSARCKSHYNVALSLGVPGGGWWLIIIIIILLQMWVLRSISYINVPPVFAIINRSGCDCDLEASSCPSPVNTRVIYDRSTQFSIRPITRWWHKLKIKIYCR